MSPFDLAQAAGYGKNDILKFLSKANPMMSQALSVALQNGYSSDQVFQYLSKSFAGAKVDPRTSRKVFGDPNAANIMRQSRNAPYSPSTSQIGIGGALTGAAVGGAVGGIPGAIAGGVLGYNQLDKLSKAYEQHVQRGGKIPFSQFLTNLAKGVAVAGIGANALGPLQEMAKQYLEASSDEKTGEEQPPMQEEAVPTPQPEGSEVEEEIQFTKEEPGKESYDLFKEKGIDRIIDSFSTEITPPQAKRGIKNLFGADYIKDIERETKKPIEKVLEEAFGYVKSKSPGSDRSSYVQKAMKGIEFSELPSPIQNRVRMINNQIESLEKKGVPYDSKRIQKLLKKRDKYLGGEGLGFVEREQMRFQKQYGEIPEPKPMQEEQSEVFTEIFKSSVPESEETGTIQKNVKPLENSLKSSNVVGAFYDDETNKMRTVFRSGDMYEYENITLDELQKVTGGGAKPVTEGATQYGFWFPDKKKSVGAAFNKFIKKKSEDFPYKKLESGELKANESQLRDAVRTFNVSGFFEPFKEQRKKGQQLEKGKVLKGLEPSLKEMDDDFLQEMVSVIEDKLRLKTPIKMSRLQKEFREEFL